MKKAIRWIFLVAASALEILPVALKLFKLINWPWIWVIMPIGVTVMTCLIYILAVVVVTASALDY